MTIFILCLFIPLIYLGYISERKIDSPMFLFPLVWGIISTLASLRLFNLIEVSNATYAMIIMGTYSFVLGCLVTKKKRIIHFASKKRNERSIKKTMIVLQLLALIVFLYSSTSAISLLRSGSSISDIYNMRIQMAYGSTTALSSGSALTSILLEYFARPVLAISIPYAAIVLMRDKKKIYFILTILMLILSFVNRGNRLDIACFLLTMVFSFRMIDQNFRISKKQKRYVFLTAVIGIVLIFIISTTRENFNMVESFYFYFCGNVPFADIKLNALNRPIEHTYFTTSLQGIVRFINQIFETFHFGEVKLFSLAEQYAFVEKAEVITTNGGLYNAFIGPFYFFYCDGGWLGVIIFSFINGLLSEQSYKETRRNDDIIMWMIYLIVIVRGIILSFYNYLFASITYGMAAVLLIIIAKRSNKKAHNYYKTMEE